MTFLSVILMWFDIQSLISRFLSTAADVSLTKHQELHQDCQQQDFRALWHLQDIYEQTSLSDIMKLENYRPIPYLLLENEVFKKVHWFPPDLISWSVLLQLFQVDLWPLHCVPAFIRWAAVVEKWRVRNSRLIPLDKWLFLPHPSSQCNNLLCLTAT